MQLRKLVALIAVLVPLSVDATGVDIKWGKIPPEDLRPMNDSTNAGAIILGDFGEVSFDAYHDGIFSMFFSRHVRIKILSAAGYEWADVEIPYDSEDNYERVDNVEAHCVVLNPDGTTATYKLERKDILEEVVYRYHHKVRFSIPNVREGAVIEYRYRLVARNFWIQPWKFQHTIPTKISRLTTRIPSILEYSVIPQGRKIVIEKSSESYAQLVHFETGKEAVKLMGMENVYTAVNVPGFIAEEYLTSPADYLARYLFQLRGLQVPGDIKRNRITNWEELVARLVTNSNFGEQLHGNGFLKEITENVISGIPDADTAQKVRRIYRFVQNSMHDNGFRTLWCADNLKKVYDQKTGSGTDINFILLQMLRNAGVNAFPVILSTREHGKLQQYTPVFTQFNHTIVCAGGPSGTWLLDAADAQANMGMLPAADLNGSGLLVRDNGTYDWIRVESARPARKFIHSIGTLDAAGRLAAKTEITYDGYYAADKRQEALAGGRADFFRKSLETSIPDVTLSAIDILQFDSLELPLKLKIEYGTDYFSSVSAGLCYFKPIQFAAQQNPFRTPERDFDVDFNYPREETYLLNLTLPDSFTISEVPQPVKFTMPDNSIQFLYNVYVNGNSLQIMSKLSITRVMFGPDEYLYLKEMYNQIVTKQGEQLVLKKL